MLYLERMIQYSQECDLGIFYHDSESATYMS